MRFGTLNILILTLALAALGTLPASATYLSTTTINANCSTFTITVTGGGIGDNTGAVSFAFTLTPPAGSPINISGSVPITPNPDGSFQVAATHAWAEYGVTLNGHNGGPPPGNPPPITIDCSDDAHQSPVLATTTNVSDLNPADGQWTEFLYPPSRSYPAVFAASGEAAYGLPTMRCYTSGAPNGTYGAWAKLYTNQTGRDMRYYYGYQAGAPKAYSVDTVGGTGGVQQFTEYPLGAVNITDGTFSIYALDATLLRGAYPFFGWANLWLIPQGPSGPPDYCLSGEATLTTGSGGATWNTVPITFSPLCVYCPSTCSGTIGDFVWTDSNCNGIQDFAEPGLNGIKVNLKDSSGAVIATTTTVHTALQDGYYQFTSVCAGTYTVAVDESTLPAGAARALCGQGSDRAKDSNCQPAPVSLDPNGPVTDQTIDFGYCIGGGKTFSIGPSSMEGHLTLMPGDWVNGGFSFKFKNGGHIATQFTVAATVSVAVTCPQGGGSGGTIMVNLGPKTYSVPAGNTDWLPTGDQNSVLSWMGAAQAPDLCGGRPMDNAKGAVYTATVSQNPATGSLVDFRFKYRDPNAKGKGNVNCLDTTDPRRAKADVCGASWSETVTDP